MQAAGDGPPPPSTARTPSLASALTQRPLSVASSAPTTHTTRTVHEQPDGTTRTITTTTTTHTRNPGDTSANDLSTFVDDDDAEVIEVVEEIIEVEGEGDDEIEEIIEVIEVVETVSGRRSVVPAGSAGVVTTGDGVMSATVPVGGVDSATTRSLATTTFTTAPDLSSATSASYATVSSRTEANKPAAKPRVKPAPIVTETRGLATASKAVTTTTTTTTSTTTTTKGGTSTTSQPVKTESVTTRTLHTDAIPVPVPVPAKTTVTTTTSTRALPPPPGPDQAPAEDPAAAPYVKLSVKDRVQQFQVPSAAAKPATTSTTTVSATPGKKTVTKETVTETLTETVSGAGAAAPTAKKVERVVTKTPGPTTNKVDVAVGRERKVPPAPATAAEKSARAAVEAWRAGMGAEKPATTATATTTTTTTTTTREKQVGTGGGAGLARKPSREGKPATKTPPPAERAKSPAKGGVTRKPSRENTKAVVPAAAKEEPAGVAPMGEVKVVEVVATAVGRAVKPKPAVAAAASETVVTSTGVPATAASTTTTTVVTTTTMTGTGGATAVPPPAAVPVPAPPPPSPGGPGRVSVTERMMKVIETYDVPNRRSNSTHTMSSTKSEGSKEVPAVAVAVTAAPRPVAEVGRVVTTVTVAEEEERRESFEREDVEPLGDYVEEERRERWERRSYSSLRSVEEYDDRYPPLPPTPQPQTVANVRRTVCSQCADTRVRADNTPCPACLPRPSTSLRDPSISSAHSRTDLPPSKPMKKLPADTPPASPSNSASGKLAGLIAGMKRREGPPVPAPPAPADGESRGRQRTLKSFLSSLELKRARSGSPVDPGRPLTPVAGARADDASSAGSRKGGGGFFARISKSLSRGSLKSTAEEQRRAASPARTTASASTSRPAVKSPLSAPPPAAKPKRPKKKKSGLSLMSNKDKPLPDTPQDASKRSRSKSKTRLRDPSPVFMVRTYSADPAARRGPVAFRSDSPVRVNTVLRPESPGPLASPPWVSSGAYGYEGGREGSPVGLRTKASVSSFDTGRPRDGYAAASTSTTVRPVASAASLDRPAFYIAPRDGSPARSRATPTVAVASTDSGYNSPKPPPIRTDVAVEESSTSRSLPRRGGSKWGVAAPESPQPASPKPSLMSVFRGFTRRSRDDQAASGRRRDRSRSRGRSPPPVPKKRNVTTASAPVTSTRAVEPAARAVTTASAPMYKPVVIERPSTLDPGPQSPWIREIRRSSSLKRLETLNRQRWSHLVHAAAAATSNDARPEPAVTTRGIGAGDGRKVGGARSRGYVEEMAVLQEDEPLSFVNRSVKYRRDDDVNSIASSHSEEIERLVREASTQMDGDRKLIDTVRMKELPKSPTTGKRRVSLTFSTYAVDRGYTGKKGKGKGGPANAGAGANEAPRVWSEQVADWEAALWQQEDGNAPGGAYRGPPGDVRSVQTSPPSPAVPSLSRSIGKGSQPEAPPSSPSAGFASPGLRRLYRDVVVLDHEGGLDELAEKLWRQAQTGPAEDEMPVEDGVIEQWEFVDHRGNRRSHGSRGKAARVPSAIKVHGNEKTWMWNPQEDSKGLLLLSPKSSA
ncbi:hypothetical protein HDU96_007669 [Phlyctochytrium bullatum]|nr:hypothetical protein HDU96_007669 [Phlyctochytrium bullatum]